jgi:hypothetical protein
MKKFSYTESVDIGYVEIETYFEVEESEVDKLKKMTRSEFKLFLEDNASYRITDSTGAKISIVDFEEFDEE